MAGCDQDSILDRERTLDEVDAIPNEQLVIVDAAVPHAADEER
jgi:hypothetical protein